MMPMNANLVVCSSVTGVSGKCYSVAFKLNHKLDFSSCAIYYVWLLQIQKVTWL